MHVISLRPNPQKTFSSGVIINLVAKNPELKILPVGLQTFENLIKGNYLYVDKTKRIYDLIKNPQGVYFLSRPRRFGKSLTISTLDAIFKNKRELFKGLWLDTSEYKWQEYPVIRIDMTTPGKSSAQILQSDLIIRLEQRAEEEGLTLIKASLGSVFTDLIQKLANKFQKKVVVLIDEYDKAILDNIAKTEVAKECRDVLKEFYSVLKAQDENIRFILLTGVSKFSKVSVFSGLNNIKDISMLPEYADLCGYTQEELDHYFEGYIKANGFNECNTEEALREMIKSWYNGYRFSPDSELKVYNPFSTLLLFDNKRFKNYWFTSGTPKFLIDIIDEQKFIEVETFENLVAKITDLEKFDFDNFHLPSILFQTGYLTIKDFSSGFLKLAYPNTEVRDSFIDELLTCFSKQDRSKNTLLIYELHTAIQSNSLEEFFEILKSYLAAIPYDIQLPLEKYYQSMIYMICRLVSERFLAEVRTNKGRIDMFLETSSHIYIFEFKLNDSAENALKQIIDNKYSEAYLSSNKQIVLIGVGFDIAARNISNHQIIEQ